MNVPTPPSSVKGDQDERELSASSVGPEEAASSHLGTEALTQTTSEPVREELDRMTPLVEKSLIREPYSDTEMPNVSSCYHLAVKQEDSTPSPSRRVGSYADIYLNASSESEANPKMKTEIKSEPIFETNLGFVSEVKPQADPFRIPNTTKKLDEPNYNEIMPKEPKKQRPKPAKTAREYHHRKQQELSGGIQKARKINRTIDPSKLLRSLVHHDQVSAYYAGPSSGTAPKLTVSTKRDFFQQLLSGCPEADLPKFRRQRDILDEESKSFGFRRVEMKNGMWLLKGMKSRKSWAV